MEKGIVKIAVFEPAEADQLVMAIFVVGDDLTGGIGEIDWGDGGVFGKERVEGGLVA